MVRPVNGEQRAQRRIAALVGRGAPQSEILAAVDEELVAAALSNAEAHAELEQLAVAQAALLGAAKLAAGQASRAELFAAVASDASKLLGPLFTARLFDEPSSVVAPKDVGDRDALVLDGLVQDVQRTEQVARWSPGGEAGRLDAAVGAGVPIVVGGCVCGALAAIALPGLLPPTLEERLATFAEVAATALTGGQVRTDLSRLADEQAALRRLAEQAALRRVAELVARGVGEEELFATVAEEASRLIENEAASLLRIDDDGGSTMVASSGGPVPIGRRIVIAPDDQGIVAQVLRTGRPARLDDYTGVTGRAWARDDFGVGSCVGVPIFVADRIWGVLGITTPDRELPPESEQRLQQFADLIAAALANVQARAEVQQLADEQAALRRVAEIAARGVAPDVVFEAVAIEASSVANDQAMTLTRCQEDGSHVVLAACGAPAPPGTRFECYPGGIIDQVHATGRSARIDDLSRIPGRAHLPYARQTVACVAVPITVGGRFWGLLSATSEERPLPIETEQRLSQFAEIAAAAVANAEGRALLSASRARVVATADETRRRLQRDVHDGAQQRLVQTVSTLKLARLALGDDDGPVAELLEESLQHAQRATDELRDLVRGILPASLIRGGLRQGLDSLVSGLTLPVDVHVAVARLPAEIETTAYFVVAEALTNVVKHAGAGSAQVDVSIDADQLTIDVRDDGVGGADPREGTGLTGLFDRVGASEGTLTITSPAGAGTTLRATLPLGHVADAS
jgi:signal transduction histidine kinase